MPPRTLFYSATYSLGGGGAASGQRAHKVVTHAHMGALVQVDGEWTTAEQVSEGDREDWLLSKRTDPGRDCRLAKTEDDQHPRLTLLLEEVGLLSNEEQED